MATQAPPRLKQKIRLEPVTPELLDEVVRRIVAAVDPDKIILFGSYAYGTPHEHSDLDLLLVKPGKYSTLQVKGEVDSLFWDMSLPIDVLVVTPERLEQQVALRNSFLCKQILGKGRVLYERPRGS